MKVIELTIGMTFTMEFSDAGNDPLYLKLVDIKKDGERVTAIRVEVLQSTLPDYPVGHRFVIGDPERNLQVAIKH